MNAATIAPAAITATPVSTSGRTTRYSLGRIGFHRAKRAYVIASESTPRGNT